MIKGSWILVSFGLLFGSSVWSDTITTTDHLSVNGSLVNMSDGILTLNSRFNSGTRTLQIQKTAVQSIEFNSTTFNPGAPPKVLGIGPARDGPTAPAKVNSGDVVVLRGNQRRDCKSLNIDADMVRCGTKNNEFSRKVVLRILVGAR